MDYLFIIELNDQPADLGTLKQTISGIAIELGSQIKYLESDELSQGLVGIVGFAESNIATVRPAFFEKIRAMVAGINLLPVAKIDTRTLTPQDLPLGNPAKWAGGSLGDLMAGFDLQGAGNLNSDVNTYQIVSMLKGGIGGKH